MQRHSDPSFFLMNNIGVPYKDWLNKTCIKVFLNEFLESLLFICQKKVYKFN